MPIRQLEQWRHTMLRPLVQGNAQKARQGLCLEAQHPVPPPGTVSGKHSPLAPTDLCAASQGPRQTRGLEPKS